jgi:ribose-phosphate pyrophosphokinase
MPIYINKTLIPEIRFPGGECHIALDNILQYELDGYTKVYGKCTCKAFLYNSDDIMRLLLTIDAIRRISPKIRIKLEIPYFPYARQDRVCNYGEALSIRVMADLINGLNCESVLIHDPHSDVVGALVNNCRIEPIHNIIRFTSLGKFIKDRNYDLVSPDAGAEKKVRTTASILGRGAYYAYKSRNTLTGEITSVRFDDDVLGKNLLIVDDICDGGRTFIQLADRLMHNGAVNVCLYITHGIFSKGLAILRPHLSHIYCYHTFLPYCDFDRDFLTILSKEN